MKPSEIHPAGTLLAGKFRVVRLLGAGGMGAVYEVENERLEKRCALKLLHAHERASPEVVSRFRREATADGRVRDAHVVETYDADVLDTGEPYVVMELLTGETLASLIERRGQLDLAEICELVGQACDAVQAAHDAGILHRDLKPANLFVTPREGRPFVKLLDFGISRFDAGAHEDMRITREGAILGTPCYMSPEQIRGQDLDARSDVHGLGVILYECAAGKVPFRAETLPLLGVLICEGTHEYLETVRPDLPEDFRDLVVQAMAVDREERTPTARKLGEDLRAIGARIGAEVSAKGLPAARLLEEERSTVDLMRSTAKIEPAALARPAPYVRVRPSVPGQGPPAPRRMVWPVVVASLAVGAVGATVLRARLGDTASGSVPVASSTGSSSGEPPPPGPVATSSSGPDVPRDGAAPPADAGPVPPPPPLPRRSGATPAKGLGLATDVGAKSR